jgi:hypothetical protein
VHGRRPAGQHYRLLDGFYVHGVDAMAPGTRLIGPLVLTLNRLCHFLFRFAVRGVLMNGRLTVSAEVNGPEGSARRLFGCPPEPASEIRPSASMR